MGAQERLPPSGNSSIQRVKVYRLIDENEKWDDQGTGHITFDYIESSEDLGLYVIDEEDKETLLLHRICSADIYRKQGDTIISWKDPDCATELALSFQETTGCSYIWDEICSVQRNMQFNSLNNEAYHSMNRELKELPPVELSTLPSLHKKIVESGIADQMRVTEIILHDDQEFVRKLMDVFRMSEDLENIDDLHMIYKIVVGIISLNSPQILEKILGDELIMDIIGSLEYDPHGPHVHHRNFLKEHVVFKEVIPIKDPLVLSKIHQTYKVGYIKDVILSRVLDEGTIATLNSIIHSNNATVVSLLKDDITFIEELFTRLKSHDTSADSKKDLVHLLHEFCMLSKSLQMVQRLRLYRDLMNEGIFDIMCDILKSEDKKLVLTGTDILTLYYNQDPNLLRSYVARPEGASLFGLLVKGMLTDFGDDMHCQFLEILRNLLDSYSASSQRDAITEMFYEKHLGELIDVITLNGSGDEKENQSSKVKPEILLNICDLLGYCVLHHPYRIKCNFLLNNVIDKVLVLMQRKEKYIQVAAVRFLRTLISRSDNHLINHIVKNNLCKPIVDAFVANKGRYNLLDSAILELFEYIRKENMKVLVKYLVNTFWNQLTKFGNLPSILLLKVKYEQYLEESSEIKTNTSEIDARKHIDERALEKEEEEYFNEDSDEEDSASVILNKTNKVKSQANLTNGSPVTNPSVRGGRLVDYDDDDDEDDENYKPPPKKRVDEDEDEGERLLLKRKLDTKEDSEPKKLQRFLPKSSKTKPSIVFNTLCSTLSQVKLPHKDKEEESIEPNLQDKKNEEDDNQTNLHKCL